VDWLTDGHLVAGGKPAKVASIDARRGSEPHSVSSIPCKLAPGKAHCAPPAPRDGAWFEPHQTHLSYYDINCVNCAALCDIYCTCGRRAALAGGPAHLRVVRRGLGPAGTAQALNAVIAAIYQDGQVPWAAAPRSPEKTRDDTYIVLRSNLVATGLACLPETQR